MAIPRMRYSPKMDDLLVCTTAAEFIAKMGSREQLVTMLVLKEIDSIVPAMILQEREKLCDKLIKSSVMPFIPAFNVRGMFLQLPRLDMYKRPGSPPAQREVYKMLKEISIDDNNVTRILGMLETGFFPALQSLTIFAGGLIQFSPEALDNMRNLTSLTLHNTGNEIFEFPRLGDQLALVNVKLVGYVVEFVGRLAPNLTLEKCYVNASRDLPGCEDMSLVNVRWDTMSMPSKALYIEKGVLDVQPPATLERLSLVDSVVKLREDSLAALPLLTSLRLDKIDMGDNTLYLNLAPRLKDLVIYSMERRFSTMPETVSNLSLGGAFPFQLLPRMQKVELYRLNDSLRDILEMLPEFLETLEFVSCNFQFSVDIAENEFPRMLKNLRFYKCTGSDRVNVTIKRPGSVDELVIIGKQPELYAQELYMSEGSRLKFLCSRTNVLLMDLREFQLYCIDKANKSMFPEFEDCVLDILHGTKWHDIPTCVKYGDILMAYPYHITCPHNEIVCAAMIKTANDAMVVDIANIPHTIAALRALIRAPEADSERTTADKLRMFVQSMRERVQL